MNLTPKQEAFIQAYIETGNASEAYRRAYPRSKQWKKKTVWEKASRLMGKVRARVDELQDKAAEAHQVTVEGNPVELSPKEFALLEYLLHRVGEVVTRTEISEHVWDDSFDSLSNVIRLVAGVCTASTA